MKNWLFALVLLTVTPHAFADKAEDASAENEAEQMDVYDQHAIEKQTKKEAADLDRQTHSFEHNTKRLEEQSKSIGQRISIAQENYNRIAKAARKTQTENKRAQAQHDRLKAELDSLHAKTEQSRNRLQSADEMSRNLEKEIRDQNHEKTELIGRQRAAEARLQKVQGNLKHLREQQHRLSLENARQQEKTAAAEERAKRADQKTLESSL